MTIPGDELAALEQRLVNFNRMIEALDRDDDELWRFRPTVLPRQLIEALTRTRLRIVTFANLKGGVGKTTTTANLAAYLDGLGKRVLLLDLDYQGSLSAMVLRAAGARDFEPRAAERLISGLARGDWVRDGSCPLSPVLANTRLLAAGYSLAREENRLMMRWLAGMITADIRFNLLRALLAPEVAESFDVVLIDAAPRLTTGTINALAASTHLVVPTILDDLSTETLPSFLTQVRNLFVAGINPSLRLAGVLATMTDGRELKDFEQVSLAGVRQAVAQYWGPDGHVFANRIPDRVAVARAAGKRLAYLEDGEEGGVRESFERVGAELVERLGL